MAAARKPQAAARSRSRSRSVRPLRSVGPPPVASGAPAATASLSSALRTARTCAAASRSGATTLGVSTSERLCAPSRLAMRGAGAVELGRCAGRLVAQSGTEGAIEGADRPRAAVRGALPLSIISLWRAAAAGLTLLRVLCGEVGMCGRTGSLGALEMPAGVRAATLRPDRGNSLAACDRTHSERFRGLRGPCFAIQRACSCFSRRPATRPRSLGHEWAALGLCAQSPTPLSVRGPRQSRARSLHGVRSALGAGGRSSSTAARGVAQPLGNWHERVAARSSCFSPPQVDQSRNVPQSAAA